MVALTPMVEKSLILFGTISLVSGIFLMVMNSKKIVNGASFYLSGILTMIIGIILLAYVVKKRSRTFYPMADFIGTALFVIGIFFIIMAAYNKVDSRTTYYSIGGSFIFVGILLTGYALFQNWQNNPNNNQQFQQNAQYSDSNMSPQPTDSSMQSPNIDPSTGQPYS